MKRIHALVAIALLFFIQSANAETVSDGNISVSLDVPEYVSQNETFLINLSVVDINVYPVVSGTLYVDALQVRKYMINFQDTNYWNKTVQLRFRGGVGGAQWYLPSDVNYSAGQTVPLKFRAEEVTHYLAFLVKYLPVGYGMVSSIMIVGDTVTVAPVFDPSVIVTVSDGSSTVFEAVYGKGVDYVRYSEGNQQYIVNWDTSGNPPGEYYVRVRFSNGYVSEAKITLH